MTDRSRQYVEETLRYIDTHYMEPIRAEEMAKRLGISRSYLSRLMQEYGDFSLMEYLRKVRLEHGRIELITTNRTVAEIAKAVGYRDAGAFSKYFRAIYGTSPGQYRSINSNS